MRTTENVQLLKIRMNTYVRWSGSKNPHEGAAILPWIDGPPKGPLEIRISTYLIEKLQQMNSLYGLRSGTGGRASSQWRMWT